MTQTAAGPIALTSDGQAIFPAHRVEPGQHLPLGVLADGRPVWPVAPGAGPAGKPQPLGVLPDGTFLFGAGSPSAVRPSKPLWQKKRVLIPAGLLVVGLIGSAVSGPSKTEITPSAKDHSTTSAQKAPAKTDAELAADKVAADKAAAAKTAADKVTAQKAGVEKAAADKAAAKKAAADKVAAAKAAAKKAAADKVAAAQAAAEAAAAAKLAAESAGQENARESAANYLGFAAFSRSGLIKQLTFEGFSLKDATYGVDSQNANWNAQAAKAAQNYLDMTSFSRSGLIQQLTFEGYTRSQAAYGVSQVGL